jgi:hypothetical protein
LTALVGNADAAPLNFDGGYASPGAAHWVQGAGSTLFTDPPETLVGVGTNQPKATLHVESQNDASLHGTYGAVRVSREVTNGQEFVLIDANEIMAGAFVSSGSVPYVAQSPLHLQHEGGDVMINGSLPNWTQFGGAGVSTGGPIHVRSNLDAASNLFNGSFVIGTNGTNVALDGNELMARSNGHPSELYLNAEGGSVIFHGSLPESSEVVFYENGRVRIGQSNSNYAAQAKLSVDGLLVAGEIRVTPDGWADDVFSPGYTLLSDAELEAYVREHRHLPGIPSEASVMENGLPVASFSTNLLRNVEELTLRVVAQSKELEAERRTHARELEAMRKKYDDRLAKLEARLDRELVKR